MDPFDTMPDIDDYDDLDQYDDDFEKWREDNDISMTDIAMSNYESDQCGRFCGAFLNCEGATISASHKSRFYRFMKRKTVQTKYDVPVRQAFR